MPSPTGAIVGLYVDSRLFVLAPGDMIRTQTGRSYEVVEARVQQRGKWAGIRQHLRVVVLEHDAPVREDQRVMPIRWYRR
ncbi:hypothetical protein GCM10009775_04570 [Microbacterium aoyamense]|uniref:Uncharacterized protein n=1 Tax=Microbacterium aoyamense TaxID=344166 RepID=A0ABN2P8Z3_9MICO